MSFNKITMVGNVGRDPELRSLARGRAVCNFDVAVNETTRYQQSSATWFRVTVWGERAAVCARNLKKGSAVYVAGRLKPRKWEDKQGEIHVSLDVNAYDVRFFGLSESKTLRAS